MSLSKERSYLLYLLAKQDYSRKQLSDKLLTRSNISNDEIIDLLNVFEKNKWLSDERFAETFVYSEVNKLRGKKRILNTGVYQKGLTTSIVEKYLDIMDTDWFELCCKCLNKKYKNNDDLKKDVKLKNKATNYLIYNGFSYDEINHAIYNTNPN